MGTIAQPTLYYHFFFQIMKECNFKLPFSVLHSPVCYVSINIYHIPNNTIGNIIQNLIFENVNNLNQVRKLCPIIPRTARKTKKMIKFIRYDRVKRVISKYYGIPWYKITE